MLAQKINSNVMSPDQIQRYAPSVFATQEHERTSDKYLFIPTVRVMEQIQKQGFSVIGAGQNRSRLGRREHTRHMLRFRRNDLLGLQNGEVAPDLILFNSHDGSSAFTLNLGLFRFACANGLIVGDSFAKESVRHIGYDDSKIIDATYNIIENQPRLLQAVESFRDVQLNQDEAMAFAKAAIDVKYDDKTSSKPLAKSLLISRRREDEGKSDLWTVFNRVQENMIRGGIRTYKTNEQGQPTALGQRTRAINSVTENKRLNQALWTLAEEMKNIKA